MFKSLTSKIFLAFTFLILLEVGILTVFLSKKFLSETETWILETLTQRIQLTSLQVESAFKEEKNIARLTERFRIILDPPSSPQNKMHFPISETEFASILPKTGTIVTPCRSMKGEPFMCAATRLNFMDAWVVDWIPKASITEVFTHLVSQILGILALLCIPSLIISYLLARFLLLPLKKFSAASELIAQGKYDIESLPTHRTDEVGDFALAFQKMIKDIQSREIQTKNSALKLAHAERLASIGMVGASIAHEIKNPLTAIAGYAQLLKQNTHPPQSSESAEIIQKEVERCQTILQHILRFSRNDPLDNKPYILREVITAAHLLVKAEARKKQIDLKVEIQSPDLIVKGSPQQVQQVVLNLLMNALQAAPPSSQIDVRLKQSPNWALIEVQDQGPGIPLEMQERIFEPFFTTKSTQEGTGLGLSVSKEIIEQQGGRLTFENIEPHGALFRVELPLS